jgi:RecJ-like exonuclease
MGFVSVTCSNCAGKGSITVEKNCGQIFEFRKKDCNECDGVGSHLVHAGRIGSYHLSMDPSGPSDDEAWAVVFKRLDNDVIEVVDFMQVDQQDPEVRAHHNRAVFGRFSRWNQ